MNPQNAVVGTPTPDEQKSGILGVIFEWFAHPFNSGSDQGTLLTWLLWIALLFVAGWFWYHTLLTIIEE